MILKIENALSMVLVTILLFTCNSCNDSDKDYMYLSKDLRLDAIKVDEGVKLTWTLTNSPGFVEYRIYKSTNPNYYDENYYSSDFLIYSTSDSFAHEYIDKNPSSLGISYYWVQLVGNTSQKSNLESITISDYRTFNSFPIGAVFNDQLNVLGFIDIHDKFTLYNYSTDEIINSVDVDPQHKHPAIGEYNGQVEVYLGTNRGEVSAYSATNLTLKRTYSVSTSYGIYSIAYNPSGILYFSPYNGDRIYSYNISKNQVSDFYVGYDEISLCFVETYDKLIGIENDSYPNLYTFDLTSSGEIQSKNRSYLSDYYYPYLKNYGSEIYTFPDLQTFSISNISNLNYYENESNDVIIENDIMYLAVKTSDKIFKKRDNTILDTYDVPGRPIYIFKDGDQLITLFIDSNTPSSDNYKRESKGCAEDTPFGIVIIDL